MLLRAAWHVEAAITSPWSNGQTEGQTTKLKQRREIRRPDDSPWRPAPTLGP